MIKGIYGINIAVKDLDAAVGRYEAFFGIKAQSFGSEFFAFPGLVGAQFNINGFHLNLIASLAEGTSVAQFLERRGEGVFLLSVEVDDIENDVARMRDIGALFFLEDNASGPFGQVNFAHPKSMNGVQVEVYQPSAAVRALEEA